MKIRKESLQSFKNMYVKETQLCLKFSSFIFFFRGEQSH